jgi:hypothetical protein
MIKKINDNTTHFNIIFFLSNIIYKFSLDEYKKKVVSNFESYCENLAKNFNVKEDCNFKINNSENDLKNDKRGKYLLDINFENY